MSGWKPKAAAAHLVQFAGSAAASGRVQEAGGLALAILEGAWATPERFTEALIGELGFCADDAEAEQELVMAQVEPDAVACGHCGLVHVPVGAA